MTAVRSGRFGGPNMAEDPTMRCPTCDVNLIRSERFGVRAAYCPECDGEWFAGGAVDRLLDRAASQQPPAPAGRDGDPAAGPSEGAAPDDVREGTWNWF